MAENYAEKIRSQYMTLLMGLTRIFLLLKEGSVEAAETLADSSEAPVQQFSESSRNEYHAQHIKVHYLMLNVLCKISTGKVRHFSVSYRIYCNLKRSFLSVKNKLYRISIFSKLDT